MIDITKIILLIISFVSFGLIIFYVVKSFKGTCPEKTHYDTGLNQCVQDCNPPQINNNIDGSCVCPNKTDIYDGGECKPKCPSEKPLTCGKTCYSTLQQSCNTKNELCANSQTCGDNCCGSRNGQTTTCSNEDIVFKSQDSFNVIEGGSINVKITIPPGSYSTKDSTLENYYPKILGNLLTNASETAGNPYVFTVTLDSNKQLNFGVTSNKSFQPTFNFDNTTDSLKFGFDNTTSFTNDTLVSKPLDTMYCYETDCLIGKIACGDYGCCDVNSCINTKENLSICCLEKDGNKICGTGNDKFCCPKEQDCCGTVCCEKGEKCIGGKCQIACTKNDRNGKVLYCDPAPPGGNSSEIKTGKYCVEDKDFSYCGHHDCIFEGSKINPPYQIYGMSNSVPVLTNPLEICTSSSGKLYSNFWDLNNTNSNGSLSRTITNNIDTDDSSKCTTDDCDQLNKFYGLKDIDASNANKCVANYGCELILDNNDKIFQNKCPFGEGSVQCCYSSDNKFTGQVCPDGSQSYRNSDGTFDCLLGWRSTDIQSPGHGKECQKVYPGDPNMSNIQSLCSTTITQNCCKKQCIRGYTGDKCDTVISTDQQVIDLLNNMPYIQQQYGGEFQNLFDDLTSYKANFFSSDTPYTYVLVYCISETGGSYKNYCANDKNAYNYWTDNTKIQGFYNTLGQDIGDLVWNGDGGVGFWWNTNDGDCPPKQPDSNTRYISVDSGTGKERSESGLGSGVKFFPSVFARQFDIPVPSVNGDSGTYAVTKTLGVLLIYGP